MKERARGVLKSSSYSTHGMQAQNCHRTQILEERDKDIECVEVGTIAECVAPPGMLLTAAMAHGHPPSLAPNVHVFLHHHPSSSQRYDELSFPVSRDA